MIKLIEENKRHKLTEIFADCRYDRVLIDSVIEGNFGTAHAIVKDDEVLTARLDSGAFTMIAGDADAEEVNELINVNPIFIITAQNDEWDAKLKECFAGRTQEISFTQFSSDKIRKAQLENIIASIPDDYVIKSFDKEMAKQAVKDLENEYLFENFTSVEDYLQRGIGYCIIHQNQVVCAATSMAKSKTAIDIEIQTHKNYRRKGLATIAGAKLVLGCMEQGVEPTWLAANPESEKLANKLGYQKTGMYKSLYIPPEKG